MRNLETASYLLAWGNGQGRGTYIIIRKADDKATLRNTGSEAVAEYKKLVRAFRQSKSAFDALCAKETFTF